MSHQTFVLVLTWQHSIMQICGCLLRVGVSISQRCLTSHVCAENHQTHCCHATRRKPTNNHTFSMPQQLSMAYCNGFIFVADPFLHTLVWTWETFPLERNPAWTSFVKAEYLEARKNGRQVAKASSKGPKASSKHFSKPWQDFGNTMKHNAL